MTLLNQIRAVLILTREPISIQLLGKWLGKHSEQIHRELATITKLQRIKGKLKLDEGDYIVQCDHKLVHGFIAKHLLSAWKNRIAK